jgi:hypothetical protein
MTPAAVDRWNMWGPLVRWRHPLLLVAVLLQTWGNRLDTDWNMLTAGGHALFGPSALSLYQANPNLQAGPPVLVIARVLDFLPGEWGVDVAHVLLALIGWALLYLAERWYVPDARFFSAPPRQGLLTLIVGLPVLLAWVALAGHVPHLEDGLALLTFVLAFQAVSQGREVCAALLAGLAAAWKPWAVVALPLLWGLPRRWRMLALAVAVPAVCWLPFMVGDPATLSTVSHGFELQLNSTVRALGLSSTFVPSWWRGVELGGALAAAGLVAVRRDWRMAFAAGCTVRLLLDPAGFDYYIAGLLMATAVTERMIGLRPWRTAVLLVSMVYANTFLSPGSMSVIRACVLTFLFLSWVHPWRAPDRLLRTFRKAHFVGVAEIPAPRAALSGVRLRAHGPARRG